MDLDLGAEGLAQEFHQPPDIRRQQPRRDVGQPSGLKSALMTRSYA